MGKINIVNISQSDIDYSQEPGFFYVGRSKGNKSPLGNPYTYNGKRTNIAKLTVPTAQMAIEMYDKYFDAMYGNDETFTKAFDKIYEAYKSGIDIYLGCWCYPKPCHASIIAKKLQRKLIKEKMKTR